jgi:hypothetical protein
MLTPQSTAPARHWIQALKSSFSGMDIIRHVRLSRSLEESNRRVDLNKANKEPRCIPETPKVRGYNIWKQDPNHTTLNYRCKNAAYTVIIT